jgi:hypothetical protein
MLISLGGGRGRWRLDDRPRYTPPAGGHDSYIMRGSVLKRREKEIGRLFGGRWPRH